MAETQIRLVVFDMAGTTVRDNDAVHGALIGAMRAVGLEVSRSDANEVMGYAKPVAIERLLHKVGRVADANTVARAHGVFLEEMIGYYAHHPDVSATEGAEEVFDVLRANGIKVGLDTGFSADIAGAVVNRLGWGSRVDAWVGSDMVARGRPYPDMMEYLMRKTGVAEWKLVAKVGDTPADLLEGSGAGAALVVGVTTGAYQECELAKYPHTHLIGRLNELLPLLGL